MSEKQDNEIMVSILCLAYNHEKYIKFALESFINQKTNFKYEVIINDDCSTDNTRNIIEHYARKYPEIIKPIYQKENQYSKGKRLLIDILIPKASGKYFTICEGDDYWIDENKLQKQVDFLEKNQDFSLCVSNAAIVYEDNRKIGAIKTVDVSKELTCRDFIKGGGSFVATNTIMSLTKYAKNTPKYFEDFSIDYLWQIYLSSIGKTYCFVQEMAAYRRGTGDSWTNRMNKNPKKYIEINNKLIYKLKEINNELNYKYDKEIQERILHYEFINCKLSEDYNSLNKEPLKTYIKQLPKSEKVKLHIRKKMPHIFKLLRKIKSKFKKFFIKL